MVKKEPGKKNPAKKEPGKLVDGKYPLIEPLDLPGGKITEVFIHPVKGKDLVAAERELQSLTGNDFGSVGSAERQMCLIARMLRMPQPTALELGTDDIVRLTSFL